jgi:hypothetical protein
MKKFLTLILIAFAIPCFSQNAEDLFKASPTTIHWLGIDFSKVRLVGDFSQFASAGTKSSVEVKNKYFPAWNRLVLDEREKFDVKGCCEKRTLPTALR